MMSCYRKTRLILDKEGWIIAALVGQPDDPKWRDVVGDAAEVMQEVQRLGADMDLFTDKNLHHRQGEFLVIPVGVSFGGGQTVSSPHRFHEAFLLKIFTLQVPGNLVHTKAMRRLIQRLLLSHSIQCIMGFQSSMSSSACTFTQLDLVQTLKVLFGQHPHLEHIFSNSMFPAVSFNCGPRTVSLDHTDHGNLSHGLCALTALGAYDHTRGGHLILFGLKLAIQFPVGSTALIPSGCMDR